MDKNKISDSHLKQIRDRLFIAQRAYKTFSRCCQEIIRAANEKDLLHKVCEAIVKEGGYRLAWAGFAEHDKNKTVRPAAQAGYEEGYLDTLNITWADRERGWGPTGTAIRTGKPSIIKNILTDPTFAPWRPEAIRRGYESSISLPLIAGGQSFGALNIYAAEPDAFDEEEVKLLTELADELAYGITALRAQIEGKRAEERLKYSEKNYRELVENALVGVYKTNVKGEILFANEALARMLEFKSPEEMISTAVLSRYKNPKDREVLIENLSKEGKVSNFEFELLTKTGKTKNAILSATLDGDIISGMIRDITELKRAEKELAHTLEILRKSLWATTHAICMIVESRDPYTAGHQRRVSDLARAIATEMGLPGSIIDGIRIAALLHDIGKISVPSEILTKPGKLLTYA
jgi:PAS domain S-box-containing protein